MEWELKLSVDWSWARWMLLSFPCLWLCQLCQFLGKCPFVYKSSEHENQEPVVFPWVTCLQRNTIVSIKRVELVLGPVFNKWGLSMFQVFPPLRLLANPWFHFLYVANLHPALGIGLHCSWSGCFSSYYCQWELCAQTEGLKYTCKFFLASHVHA